MKFEVNFDGLVGPTHNYSGLSYGNTASLKNQNAVSNPKAAALQGLEKMWFLASLGLKQGFFPPQERPKMSVLRRLGYTGTDQDILEKVSKNDPELLLAASSSAGMWAANAATISPSMDCEDKRMHITPANLTSNFHRAIEADWTANLLKQIFPNPHHFVHHPKLLPNLCFSDEGAANHMRLYGNKEGEPISGIELFVFGRYAFKPNLYKPNNFPARQTYEASAAIARLHQLSPKQTLFIQQNPMAIDAGAFHNDVVAVSNEHVLFYHELAFLENDAFMEKLAEFFLKTCGIKLIFIKVLNEEVPIKDAVTSYLFNSQLLSLPNGHMALLAPMESQTTPSVAAYLEQMLQDPNHPIKYVHYSDIRESMKNGGGPACLRLQVQLTQEEFAATNQNFLITENTYHKLKAWVNKHYRDRLHPQDLADIQLLHESYQALENLSEILCLHGIYDFE